MEPGDFDLRRVGGGPAAHQGTGKVAAVKGRRRVHFPDTGYVDCTVYDRYGLTAGASYRGPAVVEERESTTVIGSDARFMIDKYLNLIIDIA